jgi:hypothetical protein
MKVLFVSNFVHPDYQSDSVYHGLIDNNIEVYETHYPSFMLESYSELNLLYGRGFSLYGKLNHLPRIDTPNIIIEKIKSKFYDTIIYGCVYTHNMIPNRQCLDYLDIVKEYYPKNKVHFIDGSDESWNYAHSEGLSSYGTIWKSHLVNYGAGNPISFGIPESQLIKDKPNKEKIFAEIIPKNQRLTNSYEFNTEESYYADYAKSYYGMTWKKAQWQTMRHYEILANRCIPYFPDIDDCPALTMTNFPKDVIKEVNKYARRYEIHPNYDEINDYLFNYTRNNLTTKKISEVFL